MVELENIKMWRVWKINKKMSNVKRPKSWDLEEMKC